MTPYLTRGAVHGTGRQHLPRLGQPRHHRLEGVNRVVVSLIEIGSVDHLVGDEPQFAALVVEDRHLPDEHEACHRKAQVVDEIVADILQTTNHVVPDISNKTARQGWKTRLNRGVQGGQGLLEGAERVITDRQTRRRFADPLHRTPVGRQGAASDDSDEGPPRPDARLSGLQQEGQSSVPAEMLVETNRGVVIADQFGPYRDDSVLLRQGSELLT